MGKRNQRTFYYTNKADYIFFNNPLRAKNRDIYPTRENI